MEQNSQSEGGPNRYISWLSNAFDELANLNRINQHQTLLESLEYLNDSTNHDVNNSVEGELQTNLVNGLVINTNDDNIDAKYECCVCFDKKKRYDIVYTLCGIGQQTTDNMHFTCRDCRLQLQNTGNNQCPLCRGRL